jgi:hypothetical protein
MTLTSTIATKSIRCVTNLYGHLRQVVWVAQCRRHVEAEVRRVLDRAVSKPNAVDASLLEEELQQEGLDCWVEVLTDVLEKHRLAKLDCILERSDVLSASG